jgi:DNA-binding phage protein
MPVTALARQSPRHAATCLHEARARRMLPYPGPVPALNRAQIGGGPDDAGVAGARSIRPRAPTPQDTSDLDADLRACSMCATHGSHMKTEFDRDFDGWAQDPQFAEEYALERSRIDAIDRIVRALDAARQERGMSKADVARAAGLPAQSVRRFFTQSPQNPTLSVTVAIAAAVGQPLMPGDPAPGAATAPRTAASG